MRVMSREQTLVNVWAIHSCPFYAEIRHKKTRILHFFFVQVDNVFYLFIFFFKFNFLFVTASLTLIFFICMISTKT